MTDTEKKLAFLLETSPYLDTLDGKCGAAAKDLVANGVEIVKHGRWVWDENAMDWGLGGWVCNRCHEKNDNIPAKPDIYPYGWVGSFFCPNCGAKMDGGKDG